jgi:hypothetical protein
MKKQSANRAATQLLTANARLAALPVAMLSQVRGGGGAQPPDTDPPPGSGDSGGSGTGQN